MSSLLYVVAMAAVVALTAVWVVARTRRIRRQAAQREVEALALVKAGKDPVSAQAGPQTVFVAGLPTSMPVRGGIDVAEGEVVDIDALLAGESPAAASAARAALEKPTDIHPVSDTLPPRPVARPAAVVAKPAARSAPPRPTPQTVGADVPLRELALAWFEARGYRGAPASPAVRPIELVLRHKNDPARAYAFVVERQHIDGQRVKRLLDQARAIGLMKLLVVAEAGAEPGAADARRSVRLVDRVALDAEFRKLELNVAAKIIAVARRRASARAAA